MKILKIIYTTLAAFLPLTVSAQYSNIFKLVEGAGYIVDALTILTVGIALLVFFWGLAKFIFKIGGEGAVEDGRQLMIWGSVALFVLVSIWGIVSFLQGEFLPGANFNPPPLPSL